MAATIEDPLSIPQPFEEISHTADLIVGVEANSKEVAIARLVLALGQLLSGRKQLSPTERSRVRVEAGDLAVMAVDVLRELLYAFSTKGVIPCKCGVALFDEEAGGDLMVDTAPYDETSHQEGVDIKAVTFHRARFEECGDGRWEAEVTMDI